MRGSTQVEQRKIYRAYISIRGQKPFSPEIDRGKHFEKNTIKSEEGSSADRATKLPDCETYNFYAVGQRNHCALPPLKSGQISFLSQKMRNVLKLIQEQFSDFLTFFRLTKFSF